MFERYTEKARRVIFFARYEASQLGGLAIEPHHLLLGLLRDDQQLFTRFCKLTAATVEELRDRVRAATGSSTKLSASADMPLSSQAKDILTYAADESHKLNHKHIGTEHLLLGLLRSEQSIAAEILSEMGVDPILVRDEFRVRAADKPAAVEEMRRLAAEARDLGAAIIRKAERIEAICDQLTERSDQKGELH